jgi:hypothetical protein
MPTRVVALIGPQAAGKTSLIAGIYDLLQSGPSADLGFAGSMTLHAFEQTCHDARAASRRDLPHTERTLRGQVTFYHLDLASESSEIATALLLADRAGEEYSEARNDPDVTHGFPEIARADTITVLADGAKLLDPGLRHNIRAEARLTLQALVDAGIASRSQTIALVLTKVDAVRTAGDAAANRAFGDFDGLLSAVKSEFQGAFGEIRPFHVAASPKTDSAPRGEGLEELLKFWLEPTRRLRPERVPKVQPYATRAFSGLTPLQHK